ncbi:MAG: PD-(D/E)XK nuclease family protein [Clostridia bacterium]|nr:PD-(D/E)XK nuclease family protein [Clostridia bacterium]
MLKLICGPSGAGKTTHMTDLIRADIESRRRCFLLVPEQQAYISELDLPACLPENAGLFFEIVNFSRLADDVFREYGGVTAKSMNTGIRSLLMWDTLRSLSPMLTQYGKNARSDLSLSAMMLNTVDELKLAGVESFALEEAAKSLNGNESLQKKISDIAMIQETFSLRTEEVFGTDPTDKLLRMAETLEAHHYFEGCNIYVDSFSSFTAQEYRVLREIMRQAGNVTVALCTDCFFSKLPQFESLNETVRRLSKLAADVNIDVEKIVFPAKADKKPKTLQILERDLWRFDLRREDRTMPPIGESDVIRMSVCNNLYEEAEFAALHILELVQGGMSYGDIAIVMRDSEVYRGVIDAALERYGIPFFFSERTDLSAKPLSRLILSALRAVDRHYQTQDVIALVKTGLCGIDPRDAALFEEYCETWHISGSRFTEDVWSMNPDGLTTELTERGKEILETANRVRRILIPPLVALNSAIRASETTTDLCRAVYDYLVRINIPARLSERAKKELQAGQRREAGETLRLYQFVLETLSGIGKVLPDEHLSTEEFISALTLIFSTTDLGSVPNVHDCVTVGSADTMRVEKIRATLVLGLCEGEFPKVISDDGILCETDKEALEAVGIILDSRERIRNSEELLYAYRAMTKPRERLFLSTVASQLDGSARTPSLAFTRVQYLFDMKPESLDLTEVKRTVDGTRTARTEAVLAAPPKPGGTTLRLSQSKISKFLNCPYSYYSTYTLRLRDKKDSTPSYSDDGTFMHYILEHFLRAARQEDGTLALPDHDEIEPLADRIIADYLATVCPFPPELLDSRMLHLFSRLRRSAIRMLQEILGELRVSRFVPTMFEQVIGATGTDGLPPFEIPLENGNRVLLTGKIDRIDFLKKDGQTYVRIVDYKSGKHEFSIKEVKTGFEIQLVLYLFSVVASDPAHMKAAGAQYLYTATEKGHTEVTRSGFLLQDEEFLAMADTSEGRIYSKRLKPQSYEDIRALEADMTDAVSAVATRILSGEAQKTPSEDACKFCPVKLHCDKASHE